MQFGKIWLVHETICRACRFPIAIMQQHFMLALLYIHTCVTYVYHSTTELPYMYILSCIILYLTVGKLGEDEELGGKLSLPPSR